MVNILDEVPVKRNHLIVRELKNEFIIIDSKNSQIHSLNETAAAIWRMCDDELSVDDMAQRILKKFDVSFEMAKSDVEKTLRSFFKKGLINHPPAQKV